MVGRAVVFIGSSTEGLSVAEAMQAALHGDEIEAVLWNSLFEPGETTLEALDTKAADFDFAILVLSGDDVLVSRNVTGVAPRDNLLFELGLFVGRLGRDRVFHVCRSNERPKLPTDLAGTTWVEYTQAGAFGLHPAVAAACQRIRARIHDVGPRSRVSRQPATRLEFGYLPDVPIDQRGWRVGHDVEGGPLPHVGVAIDTRFGRSLVMTAPDGAYMDWDFPFGVVGREVEWICQGSKWVFYLRIEVARSHDGRFSKHAYLRLSERDRRPQKLNDHEWFCPHRAVSLDQGWNSIQANVQNLVACTFGTEGWQYRAVNGLRLRGKVTLASMSIYA